MFTPQERETLRRELIDLARRDPRITGGAVTGSGSTGNLDRWSDIDLAFGVDAAGQVLATLADFSEHMRRERGAIDQVDVVRDPWIYRVFLLPNTLQVDLAFAPATHFGARAPSFRLVFGTAAEQSHVPPPAVRELIGYGWLYALHVRSSIARAKLWQAEYMVSAMRDQVLSLACVRYGLPAREGRGIDELPAHVTKPLEDGLVAQLERSHLLRAFAATTQGLLHEVREVDVDLAAHLGPVLEKMIESVR